MHFLSNRVNRPPKDLAYWRDLTLGALGAVCILGCLGHILDWRDSHTANDRNIALGFLIGYCFLALLAPKRYKYVFFSLIAIIGWGILGAISHATLIGFVVIIPCALLVYALVRWKRHLLE
jgi:hypothetical protein